MNTLKKFYILAALVAISIVVCSPANAELNPSTATNTTLPSSIPTFSQITAVANTPVPPMDLKTSSTNLVGHWGRYIDGEISETEQCYFGELNADGIGTYFEISGGNYIEGSYRIISEDLDTTEVVFMYKGDPDVLVQSLKLSRFFSAPDSEGLSEYQYVDSQTEPEKRKPLVKRYKYE